MNETQASTAHTPTGTGTGTGNGSGSNDTDMTKTVGTGRVPQQANARTGTSTKRTGHNSFKGDTAKMNGHVFQLHSERMNKSQFGIR